MGELAGAGEAIGVDRLLCCPPLDATSPLGGGGGGGAKLNAMTIRCPICTSATSV
jgi:hypothetical protein